MTGLVVLWVLGGCAGDGAERGAGTPRGELASAGSGARESGERPVAIIDGVPLGWGAIGPDLAEAAGATVVEEIKLDRRLARELSQAGLGITSTAVERERSLLVAALREADGLQRAGEQGLLAGGSPVSADDLLRRLRVARGLGERRFGALLSRSAGLRALVAPGVVVDENAVQQEWSLRYGERARCRLIVTASQVEAAAVRARVLGAGGSLPEGPERARAVLATFIEEASRTSIDPTTAARGGLIGEINPADAGVPMVIRRAAEGLPAGGVGPVIALEGGFGVLMVESTRPASGPELSSVRADLERTARLRRERLAMDELAARLSREARAEILDRALLWSVTTQRGE